MKPVVYKSEISPWIFVPFFGVFTFVLVIFIYNKIWFGVLFLVPILLFVIHMLLNTNYTVADSFLKIRCGSFNQIVDISTIKKITETNNPISSPATSLDRLEIAYNKWDRVIISPSNKMEFIAHLLKLNPTIVIKMKKPTSKITA